MRRSYREPEPTFTDHIKAEFSCTQIKALFTLYVLTFVSLKSNKLVESIIFLMKHLKGQF